jgi:hypothetical protein
MNRQPPRCSCCRVYGVCFADGCFSRVVSRSARCASSGVHLTTEICRL